MDKVLLLITIFWYSYQTMKFRKEVKELEDKINCIDKDFWKE